MTNTSNFEAKASGGLQSADPPGHLVGLPGFASPLDFEDSPLSKAMADQPILLGLFLPIQAGGFTSSTLPRTTSWHFEYNRRLILRAEAFGFDLAFALSQWLPKGGYGGVYNGQALDSFVATSALSAITTKIILISTIHVLYGPWHPLHLAKFGATLDHITQGRWGINVVTGHRAVEHEMFGGDLIEHDLRYVLAAEFIEVVQRLWQDSENFSYKGRSPWGVKNAYVTPKPMYGRPILVNATGSEAGFDFAGRYSDLVFVTSPAGSDIESALESLPEHVLKLRKAAARVGRSIRTLINPLVIARPTEQAAWEQADRIIAHLDIRTQVGFRKFKSDAHAWKGREGRQDKYANVGGNIYIIGTPRQVVDQFQKLHDAGIDGIQVSFFDFEPDLEYFGKEILPLMQFAGLRK